MRMDIHSAKNFLCGVFEYWFTGTSYFKH
uniref:Uncharacterized protein n=1 Tax=Arundo donax TaxID=35708 RepID=A0A0A9EM13_ARUDO